MNPNASTFVPSTKMDAAEQKKYEQQHVLQQIGETKKDLAEQNAKLVLLHGELNETYAALCSKEETHSAQHIELLHSKYTQQSQLYYKQYSRFNDLNADLVYLQQKLHRLLLSPAAASASPADPSSIFMKGDALNEHDNNNHSASPSSPSFTVLPPIMESDAEFAAWDADDHDYEEEDTLSATNTETKPEEKAMPNINNMMKQMDYVKVENQIDIMLDSIWNSDVQTIRNQFRLFIFSNCMNCKTIEILINCIIIHAVNNKPVFFGAKYSVLCQSIIAYLNEKLHARAIAIDLFQLIWCCCYDSFRKLQFGNNSEKFINIMIIIAELLNADLLSAQHVFQYIFKGILCKNDAEEVCENDIEGIYEIFKRCAPSLTAKAYRHELDKYLTIMHNIKTWRKFHNGINKVPFMINEMQNIANNYTQ